MLVAVTAEATGVPGVVGRASAGGSAVVTVTGADAAETRPAPLRAATVNVYAVEAVSPVSDADAVVGVATTVDVLPVTRRTSYPVTPLSASVDAAQVRRSVVAATSEATGVPGTLGAVVSVGRIVPVWSAAQL